MITPRAKLMINSLQINNSVMRSQFKGLADADLLLQPESQGNCANWILGHIIVGRNTMLVRLGEEAFWGDDEKAMYQYNTAPITDADCPHLAMDDLLKHYDDAEARLVTRLEAMTDDEWDAPYRDTTLVEHFHFLVWHEAYHTGQFEYLRQLTGINDKVI